MNPTTQNRLIEQFATASEGSFEVGRVLGSGKTAVVFTATRADGSKHAVKLYDPDVVARFGDGSHRGRFGRELGLAGHTCQNLVTILGGAEIRLPAGDTFYLEMGLVDGCDLRSWVEESPEFRSDVRIRKALHQLWKAADFLLSEGLCHRDIKVDNIRVTPSGDLVLLDLGVLRPFEGSALTIDGDARHFIGTLRYASPEYLHGREEQTVEGWTALTIYQIGTVLYELIHGARLFGHIADVSFADMVVAVGSFNPPVLRSDVGLDLLQLTRYCLNKDPSVRLRLVPWQDIAAIAGNTTPDLGRVSSDVAELIRGAREEFAVKVEQPGLQLEKREQELHQAMEASCQVFANEADLKRLGLSVPQVRMDSVPPNKLVTVQVRRDLSCRLVTEVRFVCHVERSPKDPAALRVAATLLYGDFFKDLSQTKAILAETTASDQFEVIWEGTFDEASFRAALRPWLESTLRIYLEKTADEYKTEMAGREQRLLEELADGRKGGAVFGRTRRALLVAVTTQGARAVSNKQTTR
jgi:serine/threonine protein kinase